MATLRNARHRSRRALAPMFAIVASTALFVALPGCSTAEDTTDPTCQPGASEAYVITELSFTRENPKGVAAGFDLDKRVSAIDEQESCGKADLKSPDGTEGIDNQLALLVPDVEKQVGNAVDGIIQGAINDGRLLIALDLANVNDTRDDKCVDLKVSLLDGKPTLGTDGIADAYQTFDLRKEGQLESNATNGKIENRTFTIGPFPLRIPIAIFDVSFTIFMRDAVVRFTMDDEGNAQGLLGGGVSIKEIADGVRTGAGVERIIGAIIAAGNAAADLAPDPETGRCTLISAALAFKARRAFVRPAQAP